jgi:energy-coupling factor transporter ATP-binding protein EcfA2
MNNSSLPNSPNRLPTWFLLLITLGIPSAAGLTFAQTITQHPWQAVGIALFYEVGVLLISMVTGVWQQLQSNWVKRIAGWADSRIDAVLFNYQRSYCRQLRDRNRYVQSVLLQAAYSLELKQIFVAPKLALRTRDQGTSNPLENPRVFRGQHAIWHYLSSETETKQHLVIIGAPGSGKSTLLQDVVLTLVGPETHHRKPKVPYRLPFLLRLSIYNAIRQDTSSFSLADALQKQQGNIGKQAIPQGWIQKQLTKGRCLVLLDGLDEISDPKSRLQATEWVQEQIYTYGNNNCFVITSRPSGYDSKPLDGVMQLVIQGFTFEQIKEFIDKWYYAIEAVHSQKDDEGIRMRAEEGAQKLLQRLRGVQAFFDLACNPLLLTMMVTIHQYSGELPGSRAELYKKVCHVFLEQRTRWEVRPFGLKQEVLQTLAYDMMRKGIEEVASDEAESVIEKSLSSASTPIAPKVFLQKVEQDGIWIEGQQPDTYRFVHKTFQEYLTAMYVREKRQEQILVDHLPSNWWHETIFLYCTTGDATPIISACLKENRLSKESMELALDLQRHEEVVHAHPDVYEQFTRAFSQAIEGEDVEWRHDLAEALLTRRTRHLDWIGMVSLNDEPRVADTSLITCAEYQLFLDEQKDRGYDYLPDHWGKEHRFASGQGLLPVLGVRPSDANAFCNWLTERDPSGAYRYRLPKISAHEQEKIGGVRRGTVYWMRKDTGFTWEGELPNNVTLEQLKPFYEKDTLARDHYFAVYRSDNLREHITLANTLIDIRHWSVELASVLTSIYQIIADHTESVETNYKKVQQMVRKSKTQLDTLQQQEAQLDLLEQQEFRYKGRVMRIEENEQQKLKLQNIDPLLKQDIEATIKSIEQLKLELQIQKPDFEAQIESTEQLKIELQSQLACVRTCTSTIDRIRKYPLIAPNQEAHFDKPFADALARNRILDLDSILSSIEDNNFKHAFKNTPAQMSKFILAYAQDTVQALQSLKRDIMNLHIDNEQMQANITRALTDALTLANRLGSSHTSDRVLSLADMLMRYLEYISEKRSDLRKNSLLRWYIRFFSRVLVGHLLYWGQNESSLLIKQSSHSQQERKVSQDIIDAYLDIYVAFVMLEGRILKEPSFLPCEGILIVKEAGEAIPIQK